MSPFFVAVLSVNIDMQYDFIDPDGNYDLLYPYVKDKSLRRVIDIGAWWGPWSLWWHDKVQHIEIFEPNQQIISKLKNNIKDLPNCTLHETALGDKSGKVSMDYVSHTGTYHIKDTNGSISLKTLDQYNFESVDIIKIDAEGHEYKILQGSKKFLSRDLNITVQLEINAKNEIAINNDNSNMSIKLLKELGYLPITLINSKFKILSDDEIKKIIINKNAHELYFTNKKFI